MTTGLEVTAPLAGIVPEFEERETAIFCGYTWAAWLTLTREDRSANVAHRRLHFLIESHSNEAVSRASEAEARRAQAARNA